MRTALNAGFGIPLIDRDFADLDDWGFSHVRTDVQPGWDNRAILTAFVGQAVAPLVILGPTNGPGQLTAWEAWADLAVDIHTIADELAIPIAVNIGNEPNLADYWQWRPFEWSAMCEAVYGALREDGFEGLILAASDSNFGAAQYPAAMHWDGLPADLIPDIHWYSDEGDFFHRPKWGDSLPACYDHVKAACAGRAFAVSEFGLSSRGVDDETFDALCAGVPREDWIGSQLTQCLDFLKVRDTPLAGVFQINDGPLEDHESHYGLRYFETSHGDPWAWKPQARHLQCWHHRQGEL